MTGMHPHVQVVQADEAVFDAVQAKFAALTISLLPKLVSREACSAALHEAETIV